MTEEATFGISGPDDKVSVIAGRLAGMAEEMAGAAGISQFDVCVAFANAIGFILADAGKDKPGGKPLPRDKALLRMDALRKVMEGAYDLRGVEGEG